MEKRKRFLFQFTGYWTPDRTEPNRLGKRNKDTHISSIFRILLLGFLQMPCPESGLIIFSQFEINADVNCVNMC